MDSPSSSSYWQSIAAQLLWELMSPSPIHVEMLISLTLWRFCAGSHRCCKLMSTHPEGTILLWSSRPLALTIFVSVFQDRLWALEAKGYDTDISFMGEPSTNTFSALWRVVSFYVNHHPLRCCLTFLLPVPRRPHLHHGNNLKCGGR